MRRQFTAQVNGVKPFVDDRGDRDAPPVLYFHLGPGQGCWPCMTAQGDRLACTPVPTGSTSGVLRSEDPAPRGPVDTRRASTTPAELRQRQHLPPPGHFACREEPDATPRS